MPDPRILQTKEKLNHRRLSRAHGTTLNYFFIIPNKGGNTEGVANKSQTNRNPIPIKINQNQRNPIPGKGGNTEGVAIKAIIDLVCESLASGCF